MQYLSSTRRKANWNIDYKYALSIAVIGLADAAWADDQSICLQGLPATGKPVFSGFKEVKLDAEDGSSAEGGEYREQRLLPGYWEGDLIKGALTAPA